MRQILVIHGPNLNLLGTRKPEIYGTTTLADIDRALSELATRNDCQLTIRQSNHEGEIVDLIQQSSGRQEALIINPGAYTHTSVAIRDAIEAVAIPTIEVHLSNVYQREAFRHKSVLAPVCVGQIAGLGWRGYLLALHYFLDL